MFVGIGLGLGIPPAFGAAGGPWSPAALFGAGEQGAWYDPSDLTTLYQDHLGTIAAAYGQPVGLMRDKSGRGNHASQPTVTARPTLGRVPKGGRRNRLINSEDYSFGWTRGIYDITPVQVLPGIMGVNVPEAGRFYRVYDRTNRQWIIPTAPYPIQEGRFSATFVAPPGCVEANLYIVSQAGEQIYSNASNSVVVPGETYTISMHVSNGGSRVGGAQMERGPVMTPYQKVVSDLDITEVGVPSLSYLQFDGVDDHLVTVPINLSGSKEATMFAGVRKITDLTQFGYVLFHGETTGTVGVLAMSGKRNFLPSIGTAFYAAETRGPLAASTTGFSEAGNPHLAAPHTGVLVASYASSDQPRSTELRVNREVATKISAVAGETALLNAPLFIGCPTSKAGFFHGNVFALGFRGGPILALDVIEKLETALNEKTGAF